MMIYIYFKFIMYPKSVNNRQCVGPCFPAGQVVPHPIYLNKIVLAKTGNKPFCPTMTYAKEVDGVKVQYNTDECTVADIKQDVKEEYMFNMVVPLVHRSTQEFLSDYYDIHTFDDVLKAIDSPIATTTKLRIMNCSFNTFDFIVNDLVVDFYTNIAKKLWVYGIYSKVGHLIVIKGDKISFHKPDEKKVEDTKDDELLKIKFIKHKLINRNIIFDLLTGYVNNIDSATIDHNNKLRLTLIDKLDKKINASI